VTRRVGKDTAFHGNYYDKEKIGKVEVFLELAEVESSEQLEPYVNSSGLPSAEKWLEKATKLHKKQSMSLFHVFLCVHAGGIT